MSGNWGGETGLGGFVERELRGKGKGEKGCVVKEKKKKGRKEGRRAEGGEGTGRTDGWMGSGRDEMRFRSGGFGHAGGVLITSM